MAVTAKVASVVMVNVTGSPPFDVDGAVSFAYCGRTVNIEARAADRGRNAAADYAGSAGAMCFLKKGEISSRT